MPFSKSFRAVFFFASASLLLLACDVSSIAALLPGGVTRPTIVIQSPTNGASFKVGDDVPVQSASADQSGIVRVELSVDGQVVATDVPPIPQGQSSFSVVQKWKATDGTHTISVRSYNVAGTGSDPAIISVTVSGGPVAQASPSAALGTPAPATDTPGTKPTDTAAAAQATATRRPATPTNTRPAATPTVSAAPGVYALSIRLDPASPKSNQPITFYVTFLNTTGETKHFRWFVKIYEPDAKSSKGETAKVDNDIPAGRSELASPNNWRVPVFSDCQPFFARPFAYDVDTTLVTEFLKTDGQSVNVGFNVCP